MVKDCPNVISQVKGNGQSQPSGPSSVAQKRNCFYALKARGEQKKSPNVVKGMLQVFSVNVYALPDPGAALSIVTPLVARKFDVLPNVLIEPFSVRTLTSYFVVAKKVYRKCPVMLPNRVTLAGLVELDMFLF